MNFRIALAFSSLCLFGISHGEDVNLKETPETTSVYLTPYAIGPGAGAVSALNSTLANKQAAFLKLSLAQTWRFQPHLDGGLDLDYWAPGSGFGALLNVNYVFGESGFRPFLGLGAGFQYVDEDLKFGKSVGVQGQAMAGVYIDMMDNLHLRLRVPFQIVANSNTDQLIGLDIALLFSLPQYNTKVRKLKY